MAKLQEMGEFVRSASSTIEAPVVRRLKEAFSAEAPKQAQAKTAAGRPEAAVPAGADGQNGSRKAPAGQTAATITDGAAAPAPPVRPAPSPAGPAPSPGDQAPTQEPAAPAASPPPVPASFSDAPPASPPA